MKKIQLTEPVFKAIVLVNNQEECNVAKDICLKYSLPVWKDIEQGFKYMEYYDEPTYLKYQNDGDKGYIGFYVDCLDEPQSNYNIVSIEEFEALAEELNPQDYNIDDILSKMKELNNLLNNK
jgi:hypothetical protein